MVQALIQPEHPVAKPALRHWRAWADPDTARHWLSQLQKETPWKQVCNNAVDPRADQPGQRLELQLLVAEFVSRWQRCHGVSRR